MRWSYRWILLATATMLPRDGVTDTNSPHQEQSDYIHINQGTHLTFRRYYFISRLDKTMRLLLKIQSAHRAPFLRTRPIDFDLSLFNDKRIIRSLKRIQETRTLKPLFMIWDDFVAYKSLEDDIFIEDFSKEIFVVTRTVLSSLDHHGFSTDAVSLQQLTQTTPKTEQLLDAIDVITEELQKIVPHPHNISTHHYKQHIHTPPLDLKAEVSTDEIALRFYYIQRLTKAIDTIGFISTAKPYHTMQCKTTWKSARIESLLRAMQESGTHDVALNTWGEVKEYKFIDNLEFVKEFVTVIFIALRHLYAGTSVVESLNHTELNIENIAVEDILHAIDIITDQVSTNNQAYNEYTPSTLQEWLHHYWWIPPLTIGSIAIRLVYYYYTHQSSFGSFY